MIVEELRKKENVRKLYSDYPFPNFNADDPVIDNVIQNEMKFYAKYLKPGLQVLDAGCGTGNYVAAFAKAFPSTQFTAIDFCEESLAKATERFGHFHNIKFEHHDLSKPYNSTKAFDIVLSIGVIHHLEDQLGGLRNLHKVLKENGLLILYLYGKYGLFEKLRARNVILSLTNGLDWNTRFKIFDKLKYDKRFDCFRPQRYWFIPRGLRNVVKKIIKYKFSLTRNHEADSFFHPIESHYTIQSVFTLLKDAGFEFLEFNEEHEGSFQVPEKPFQDKYLNRLYSDLNSFDKMIIAENILKPTNYFLSARKI